MSVLSHEENIIIVNSIFLIQGALREIRKDSQFLARQQLDEQLQRYTCYPKLLQPIKIQIHIHVVYVYWLANQ